MNRINTQRGVTLIEIMVYLGLFAIIIGGAVIASYQIFESSGRTRTRAMIEDEGNFLSAKMLWALSGAHTVDAPLLPPGGVLCAVSNTFTVTKWDSSLGVLEFTLLSGNLMLSRNGATPLPLNNGNIAVSAVSFKHCYQGGMMPESIEMTYTLSARTPSGAMISEDFSTGGSLRK